MTQAGSLWTRRRAAVAAEAEAELAQQEEAAHQEAQAGKSDVEILAELELPDPETLKMGDDFAAFMSKAVPEHIRKKALRTLWRSNPVLACVDGLNDYDEDFLTGSFGNDPIKTTYQVGKGLMAHILEMERQEEIKVVVDDCDQLDEPSDILAVDAACENVKDEVMDQEPETTDPAICKPRRMSFQFDEDVA